MKTSLSLSFAALALAFAGCAAGTDALDDAAAEDGAALTLGAADAAAFTGTFTWSYSTRPYWNNDIPSVAFTAETYVRSRCYGYDCAKLIPQTGKIEWYKSSAGK